MRITFVPKIRFQSATSCTVSKETHQSDDWTKKEGTLAHELGHTLAHFLKAQKLARHYNSAFPSKSDLNRVVMIVKEHTYTHPVTKEERSSLGSANLYTVAYQNFMKEYKSFDPKAELEQECALRQQHIWYTMLALAAGDMLEKQLLKTPYTPISTFDKASTLDQHMILHAANAFSYLEQYRPNVNSFNNWRLDTKRILEHVERGTQQWLSRLDSKKLEYTFNTLKAQLHAGKTEWTVGELHPLLEDLLKNKPLPKWQQVKQSAKR